MKALKKTESVLMRDALSIYRSALGAVRGHTAVERALARLKAKGLSSRLRVLAMGKAAGDMALGAQRALRSSISQG